MEASTIKLSNLLTTTVYDLGGLIVFIIIGMILLKLIKPLRNMFLPACLIGGIVALILGPQVLNVINIPDSWSGMANPMIGITIGCSIFGTNINRKKINSYAGAINLVILTYFAQMIVGTLVGMGLSKIWTDMPEGWGVLAIYTYWGGHGAATSAGTLFESMGVDGMVSLGLIMATFGLIIAMVAGMVWVNIGQRKGWSKYGNLKKEAGEIKFPFAPKDRKPLGFNSIPSDIANSLAIQLGIVLGCVLLGKKIFEVLALIPVAAISNIMSNIPSFLYCTMGALILWPLLRKFKMDDYADIPTIKNIGGVALEICVCSATATINLDMLALYLTPLIIHMILIVILMSIICMVFVRRWMKNDWFELALMAFGQGHGSTPSGLALARCVDSDSKSNAWEAFGIAMGLVTPITSIMAASFPALVVKSIWFPVIIGAILTIICIGFGEFVIKRRME